MTKVTQLPIIGSLIDSSTFIIVDNKLTRRITYNNLKNQLGYDLRFLYDQPLYSTSSVVFTNLTVTNLISTSTIFVTRRIGIGGLNDRYAVDQGDPMLILANRLVGAPVPTILLQAYKSNFNPASPFLNSSPYPIVRGELAGGTFASPIPVSANDGIFSLSVGGHDGATWTSTRGFGNPGRIFFSSQENWSGTSDHTTNAGIRFMIQLQPPSVYLSNNSRQTIIHQYWSEFGDGKLPKNNIGFGGATDDLDTILTSEDISYAGHGSTNVFLNNSTFSLYGVPREDSTPDNYTLPDTLSIVFYASRGNGISTRRNRIQPGDTLGRIQFFGETDIQSTSTTTQIKTAELFVKSLNTFTSTATGGAVVVLTTLNSGTNIESPRLSLSNVEHIYSSDVHSFKTANSSTIVTINTTSFVVKSVRAVQGTVPAGFSPMYYNTLTGEIIVVY
jgi:hypothetical protein